ncbi:hypothetical protein MAPG_09548 [Magnaporthiopsis poae ATCC 64411]|uniref:Uncharacterized protein n=1 Tax=Magnaporthiopsis poae (strain ATCC 64411 / 73-15) TaxID=644358 RepID=A0A0C4EA89_MAGP6|nr:hypothetical protein MAPG_09548 [Magnaporthiopsis poae ATCC 64411]
MLTTLLDILTSPNLERISLTGKGQNTQPAWNPSWGRCWEAWDEFNLRTLLSIYGSSLDLACSSMSQPSPSEFDREILSEDTLEHFISRFNMPIINHALAVALERAGREGKLQQGLQAHLGRGSRCLLQEQRMDWCLASPQHPGAQAKYRCILPGDSKLDSKWNAELYNIDYEEWRKPVDQVVGYMINSRWRYGFAITDQELYVFRITLLPISVGSVPTLRTRPGIWETALPTGAEGDYDYSVADLSAMTADMTIASRQTADYDHQADLRHRDYRLQCAIVPWSAHGRDRLTVNLALWCLSMMSMGDGSIQTEYPPLDSWREDGNNGDSYVVHNTSGFATAKRGRPAGAATGGSGAAGSSSAGSSRGGAGASQYVDVTAIIRFDGRTRGERHRQFKFTAENGRSVTTREKDWQSVRGGGWVYEKWGKKYFCRKFPKED